MAIFTPWLMVLGRTDNRGPVSGLNYQVDDFGSSRAYAKSENSDSRRFIYCSLGLVNNDTNTSGNNLLWDIPKSQPSRTWPNRAMHLYHLAITSAC